ncbi:TrbG/VirB9 family P-type conjugative transfer protein [Granulicella paludicola]|uniref:TrbG/VirB9 family P-type conjugative transfer protein n=1 Tax=Granulicella paludicola TaxID=474951 RepID=UPI0037C0C9F6
MKPPIIVSFVHGFILLASAVVGHAEPQTHHLLPNAPRSVTLTEAATPPVIRAGLLQSTLILLPEEEKVATVFGGDTVDWVFDGGHVASRFISVKPKLANATTDLHIVSDHGNEYTLQLQEISGDADPHFDSKVFLVPGDKVAKDKLTEMPVFVPVAELDKAKQEVVTARAAAAAERKSEDAKAEQYRSQYPGSLHFDFTWDAKKGKELGLQQIWHDDKFTYLRGQFEETPALYEMKDGKGSLINFDYNNGLYTVPKELENGYLAIGKKKVEFHRTGGGK